MRLNTSTDMHPRYGTTHTTLRHIKATTATQTMQGDQTQRITTPKRAHPTYIPNPTTYRTRRPRRDRTEAKFPSTPHTSYNIVPHPHTCTEYHDTLALQHQHESPKNPETKTQHIDSSTSRINTTHTANTKLKHISPQHQRNQTN